MSHKFSIDMNAPEQVSCFDALLESGVEIIGNRSSGSIVKDGVTVEYYTLMGSVEFNIVKKPFIVSNSYVEGKIREMIGKTLGREV